jgi:hypothetical protein
VTPQPVLLGDELVHVVLDEPRIGRCRPRAHRMFLDGHRSEPIERGLPPGAVSAALGHRGRTNGRARSERFLVQDVLE